MGIISTKLAKPISGFIVSAGVIALSFASKFVPNTVTSISLNCTYNQQIVSKYLASNSTCNWNTASTVTVQQLLEALRYSKQTANDVILAAELLAYKPSSQQLLLRITNLGKTDLAYGITDTALYVLKVLGGYCVKVRLANLTDQDEAYLVQHLKYSDKPLIVGCNDTETIYKLELDGYTVHYYTVFNNGELFEISANNLYVTTNQNAEKLIQQDWSCKPLHNNIEVKDRTSKVKLSELYLCY